MAATVGIMRFTTRSLFVPKILVSALLIKEFLWAPSTIWADTPFYAMMPGVEDGPEEAKKDAAQASGPGGKSGDNWFVLKTRNAG
jgi:hypothetical protein